MAVPARIPVKTPVGVNDDTTTPKAAEARVTPAMVLTSRRVLARK
jgi:hypothetical protein